MFSLKKEIPSHATTMWMRLEDIILSKISQLQKKDKYDSTYMRHLEHLPSNSEGEAERWLPGTGRQATREWLRGYRFRFARWTCSRDSESSTAHLQHYCTSYFKIVKIVHSMPSHFYI